MTDVGRRRPRLLTLFTLLMLLAGGRMLYGSVMDLQRIASGKPEVLNLDGKLNADQEALLRSQVVLDNVLAQHRLPALTVHAVGRLGLGLIYFFAVAAIFSGDRRARKASLLAGWAGLVMSAANAVFLLLVVREILPWLIPMLGHALEADAIRAGRAPLAPEAVVEQSRLFLLHGPLAGSGMAAVFSLVLLAYFSGRAIRLFYNSGR